MGYLSGALSAYDEASWRSDSSYRSSLYRVQEGYVSFGEVSSSDWVDWYELKLYGDGTYTLSVSNDPINNYSYANDWSTSSAGIKIEITDSYGSVIYSLGSATAFGTFDDSIVFDYTGGSTFDDYYVKVSYFGSVSADYVLSLELTTIYPPTGIWLMGTDDADVLYGEDGNDTLVGGAGNDLLDGGPGADSMTGDSGSDTYYVDNMGDVVVETDSVSSTGGMDTVRSSTNYTLGSFVEKLVLTGSATINATGNSLGNSLTGNSAANTLNGGTGADTMLGGAGNDTYVVDNGGDRVYETTTIGGTTNAGGTDTVRSSVSFTLGSYVEKLVLTGSATINATGNSLANSLTGNSTANTLNGGTGADTMLGGAGNDTYVVDNAGDRVYETTTIGGTTNAGGTDTVRSSVNFTLGSFVEKLVLTGTGAINGTGNALANTVTGNAAANVLAGGSGNDTLLGGSGNDTLVGGAGNDSLTGGGGLDVFRFNAALGATTNVDRIADFVVADDTIQLENAVFTSLATTGTLAAGRLRVGTAAADGNDFLIYNPATGALSYDADGSGAAVAAVQFATLGTGLALTVSDFFII